MIDDKKKEQQFKTFLEKNPNEPMVHFSLGSIYLRDENRINDAIASFEKTVSLNPQYMAAYHQLAGAYKKKNELKKARAAYEQTLKLAKQSQDKTMIDEVQDILDNWEG